VKAAYFATGLVETHRPLNRNAHYEKPEPDDRIRTDRHLIGITA
jgi:hypothetical protein